MKLTYEELENRISLLEEQLAHQAQENANIQRQLFYALNSCHETNEMVFWAGPDGIIVFVNRRLCNILGVSEEELLNTQFPYFIVDYNTPIWNGLLNYLAATKSATIESIYKSKAGREYPVEIKISQSDNNNKTYYCFVAREISDNNKTDTLMAGIEGKFQSITAASPNPLLITRYSDGRLLFANKQCAELAGTDLKRLLEKFTSDFYENSNARQAYLAELSKGPVKNWEVRLRREDGSHLWVLANATIGEYEGEKAIYLGLLDITEWKSTVQALRESELKYSQAISMISDIIWQYETDSEGNFYSSYISPVADRVLGLPEGTIGNSFEKYLRYTDKEDYSRIGDIFKSLINGQKREFIIEYRLYKPDNTVLWVSTKGSAYRQDGDKIVVYGTTTDITEKKKAEEAQRLSEERFLLFMHNFPGLAYIKNSEGRVLFANEGFMTLLGIDTKEMVGKVSSELFPKDFAEKIDEDDQRVIRSGKPDTIEEDFGGKNWMTKKFPFASSENSTILGGFTIEITELKRTEAALRESEEKYRLLFENASEAILVAQDGIIMLTNKSCKDLVGYSEDELLSKSIAEFIHPDDRQLVVERHKQRLEGKSLPGRYSFRLIHKSGEPVWVELGSVFIHWNNNPATLNFITDISERKKTEEELISKNKQIESQYEEYMRLNEVLRVTNYNLEQEKERAEESEKQLHLIVNNFVKGMLYQVAIINEKERKFNYLSNGVEKLYGCTADEAKANSSLIYGRIHADDIDNLIQREQEAIINMGVFEAECRVYNPDNTLRWSYYISRPRMVNGVSCWDGIEIDITERKQIEFELIKAKQVAEENEIQFRQLFDNMEQGFALHEMIYNNEGVPVDYRFVLLNKAFEKLTGKSSSELLGRTVKESLPGIEDFWIEKYGKVAATGMPLQFENYTAELDKHYNIIAYSPKKDFFAVVFTDVTQNKNYEKELIAAKEMAEESDKLKSAFLANISHEIRTPLNAILGFGSLMNEPGITPIERNDYFNIIKTKSDDLLEIIGDILDISKIEANQLAIHLSTGNLSQMMNELLSVYELRRVTDNKINIRFIMENQVSDNIANIITDFQRVKQVLGNLLNNSFKFTDKGEIRFGCKLNGADEILFYVSDTGIGIPNDKLDKIFDRFRQVEIEISKVYGGTGLGLSISKGIIELLNGKIWVESELKKGSVFYFTIPFRQATMEQMKDNGKSNIKEDAIDKYVLIVEDDLYNRMYLEKIISSMKYGYFSANDGQSAMDQLANIPEICLVLLDIQLPDISGYDLLKKIREKSGKIPVIAQTGFAMEEDRIRCMEAGFDDFISKPIQKADLHKKIRNLLS